MKNQHFVVKDFESFLDESNMCLDVKSNNAVHSFFNEKRTESTDNNLKKPKKGKT